MDWTEHETQQTAQADYRRIENLRIDSFFLPSKICIGATGEEISMKRIVILSVFLFGFFGSCALANLKYSPQQLDQFNETNSCPYCDLSGSDTNELGINHSRAVLNGADLSNVTSETEYAINLSMADLRGTNLTGAHLEGADFSEADFTGAVLYGADFVAANFYKAKITDAQLKQVKELWMAILPDGEIAP